MSEKTIPKREIEKSTRREWTSLTKELTQKIKKIEGKKRRGKKLSRESCQWRKLEAASRKKLNNTNQTTGN
jgi:hypothetical protein